MTRLVDRLQALEQAARAVSGALVVIDCDGVPTDAQIEEWQAAAKAGRCLFIAGPAGPNWGWMPGAGIPHPWKSLV